MSPEFGDEPHKPGLPSWDDPASWDYPTSDFPPQDNEFTYQVREVEKQGRKAFVVRLPAWVQRILKIYTAR